MDFKFSNKSECMDVKLEQLSGNTVVNIDYIQFRNSSSRKIEDIFQNGVRDYNQNLVIDKILLTKENYKKIRDLTYKATFVMLVNIENNIVKTVRFTLGNVDLRFRHEYVRYDGENVTISYANMTVYPFSENLFSELDE